MAGAFVGGICLDYLLFYSGTGAECICPLILIQVIGKSPARVGIITSPYMVVAEAEAAILILSAVAVALILGKCILDAR
ncbi:hypothetical protein J1N35_041273 [Gossypium stocksii]|uniref:Uncharacterized protein n=1 Tax=Gossypium stocksii TaxID=47602 RepID=A0A9D3UFK2_9ROSI|nr:hypothetical protein J1N35_041273 [Gossypium stocksii]